MFITCGLQTILILDFNLKTKCDTIILIKQSKIAG